MPQQLNNMVRIWPVHYSAATVCDSAIFCGCRQTWSQGKGSVAAGASGKTSLFAWVSTQKQVACRSMHHAAAILTGSSANRQE
jgi:hypothetical protein